MEHWKNILKSLTEIRKLSKSGLLSAARCALEAELRPAIEIVRKSENLNPKHLDRLERIESIIKSLVNGRIGKNAVNSTSFPKSGQIVPPCQEEKQLDKFSSERESAIRQTIVQVDPKLHNLAETIVGLENAKQSLKEAVVEPVLFPDWFTDGRKPWRCILLYGPPGTGKSKLAYALSGEMTTRSAIFHVSSADIISTWMGQSEQMIRDLFSIALKCGKPALIFIDEIDSLCRKRSGNEDEATRRIKTQLLIQMQKICDDSVGQVFLLGATNCPWDMDSAFLRRFQKRIFIGLPCKKARIALMSKLFKGSKLGESDWAVVGQKSEGMSGNDLHILVQEASYKPLRELREARFWQYESNNETWSPIKSIFDQDEKMRTIFRGSFDDLAKTGSKIRPRDVELDDVMQAFKTCQRTVTDDDLKRFDEFTTKFGLIG
uniref:AAA+ ATPase domain-containing protein n=1 Tax=Romanomermis culicivorax TaxID=13658 RepID=A0A915I191_ROMCU